MKNELAAIAAVATVGALGYASHHYYEIDKNDFFFNRSNKKINTMTDIPAKNESEKGDEENQNDESWCVIL